MDNIKNSLRLYIRSVINENFLNEISTKEAWTQFYSDKTKYPVLNGDEQIFNRLNKLYQKENNNKFDRGTFSWLYNLYRDGKLKEEDFYKAEEYIRIFRKFINRIPKENRDLGKYKTLPDLYDAIEPFYNQEEMPTSKTDEKKKIKETQAEKVFEDENWLVVVPKTEEAACYYGKGTQWCTAATKSANYFEYYNKRGPLYIIINKDDSKEKYQMSVAEKEFMNAADRTVSPSYFFEYEDGTGGLFDFFSKIKGFHELVVKIEIELDEEGERDNQYYNTFLKSLDALPYADQAEYLNRLRNSASPDGIYYGFMREKDPDSIKNSQYNDMIEYCEDNRLEILSYLIKIGYENYKEDYEKYKKAVEDMEIRRLKNNTLYKMANGDELMITGLNAGGGDVKYTVSFYKKGRTYVGDSSLDIETISNYIHHPELPFPSNNSKKKKKST